MAYNSYFPMSYQPMYYQPQYQPPQAQQAAQVSNPPVAQQNSGLIWVQGEAGAKSYLVAPNTTVMLMDSESQRFFLKSADASGMPLPLRTFEYAELTEATKMAPEAFKGAGTESYTEYALKSDLEALKSRVEALAAERGKEAEHE